MKLIPLAFALIMCVLINDLVGDFSSRWVSFAAAVVSSGVWLAFAFFCQQLKMREEAA
jgi:hypothetical protein